MAPRVAALLLLAASVTVLAGCDRGRGRGERPVWDGCEEVCNELVSICSYDAYPTEDSCVEGCTFEDDQGGEMDDLAECIGDANCDTFELLACQRAFGWASVEEEE